MFAIVPKRFWLSGTSTDDRNIPENAMSTTPLTTNIGFCTWKRGAAAVAAVATLCLAAGGAARSNA